MHSATAASQISRVPPQPHPALSAGTTGGHTAAWLSEGFSIHMDHTCKLLYLASTDILVFHFVAYVTVQCHAEEQ